MRDNNAGIYCILNKINGKFYIGSTKDLSRRKNSHFSNLRKNKHTNSHLQFSYNKYGKESFKYIILERDVQLDALIIREQSYLDLCKPEYNIRTIADRNTNIIVSNETREKLRIIGHNRKQKSESIKKSVNNRLKLYKERGYFMSDKAKKSLSEKARLRGTSHMINVTSKKVYQYSKDLELINTWNSAASASKDFSISRYYLRRICRISGEAKGFIWSYTPLKIEEAVGQPILQPNCIY